MSDFEGLINSQFKQLHVDMITEVLRGCSVTCQLIFGVTKFVNCPNCIYDPVGKKSSNRFKAGGPITFNSGICPYCNGLGKIADEQTETLNLCPVYDYRRWIPTINSNITSPEGYIQTLSVFSTYASLEQAKEIIIDTAITSNVKARFERHGEPEPCGLGQSSFVATMWKRIEN